MSKTDNIAGYGYVISGYLREEGPDGVTVEGDSLNGGKPYATIEEAVAEIDASGGPRPGATIFIGVVQPVAVVVQPDWDDETIESIGHEIEREIARFVGNDSFPMVYEAGKGKDAPNTDFNFGQGAFD